MKKQLSFLSLALCISFNAFSQTSVIQAPIPGANAFERFLNTPITKKLVLNGAKVASGFIVANKFKFIVGGTVLSGIAGYNYLIHNPEKMGEFFGTHPELLNEFSKYLDYRIANAQTQEELDTFNNVKYKLALDQNINNSQSIAITNDPVYQNLEDDVREEVDKTIIAINESGNMPQCNINVVAQILEPEEDFHKGVNNILPSIENIPTKILNVNTYKNLHDNYKKKLVPEPLTPDHIPSYGALAKYFASWNLPIPTVRKDSNLELNSTSITVPTELHQKGSRTYGGRNRKKDSNNDSLMIQDAKNLLEATILDIATTAYLFYSNNKYNIIPEEYIKSSMVIVARNKLLCMYDVPYN